MATTQNTFTGDGSNLGPFSFTFKWLESTDIKVTVAGVLKTAGTHYNLQSLNYSTKTGGQVLFTAGNAPANGAAIVIYRQTDDTDLASTFYSGSAIRAQDLNNNFVQGLYVTQESSNNAAAATAAANAATTTANTALSNSTAAQASAASAISTANSAVSTANSAVSTANSAVSTANSASAAAASAVSTANTANSTASSALSAVSEALAYTTVANVAAIPGSPTNGDSLRITDSTGIESFTPIVGVPVGFVGNSALTVEIYYNGTSSTWVWSRYFPNDPENRYWSGSVIISDTAPLSPTDDSLWYDSIGGRFYIRYNDGNTSQWVDASPQGNRTSTFQAGTAALPGLTPEGDTDTGLYSPGANQLAISTGGTARATIDASGRLLVGTSTARSNINISTSTGLTPFAQINTAGSNYNNGLNLTNYSATGWGPVLSLGTSRSNTLGANAVLVSADDCGRISFNGNDGTNFLPAAEIAALIDGTPGTNDMPGRLVFATTADGAGSPTEAVRIDSQQRVGINASIYSAPLQAPLTVGTAQSTSAPAIFITSGSYNTNNRQVISYGFNYAGAQIPVCTLESIILGVGPTRGGFILKTCDNDVAIEAFRVNSSQELLVGYTTDNGNYKLQVNSQIFATSSTVATSDGRYKENVATLGGCVDLIKALRPVSFTWKPQQDITRTDEEGNEVLVREGHNFPVGTQVGFIAQEVQEVLADKPWLSSVIKENVRPAVTDAEDNELAPEEEFLGIAEGNLIAVLTSALQEAIGRIETLEAQTTSQAATIASFEARLTALEGGTN